MTEKPQLSCFVIGPIGDPGSTVRAGADDLLQYIIEPCEALKELGYGTPIRADQLGEPGRITSQVIRLLIDSDLVIADLTGNNANAYYELSLRHALGKPAIHMATEGTPLSFDLRDNRTIFYTMHARVAEAARAELSKQVRHIHSAGYRVTNPIIEIAGIIKLESSDDPDKKAAGLVLQALAEVNARVADIGRSMEELRLQQKMAAEGISGLFGRKKIGEALVSDVLNRDLAVTQTKYEAILADLQRSLETSGAKDVVIKTKVAKPR